jgi:hypothetical protein
MLSPLASYYHQEYPGFKRDLFKFVEDVPEIKREVLGPARDIQDHLGLIG